MKEGLDNIIEQIKPNIFRIEIPLTGNPLKAINSYLIVGSRRNLLVDTGFNCEECHDAMTKALNDLKIKLEDTDIFITHMHSDHAGLASFLHNPNSKIYMSKEDGEIVEQGTNSYHWKKVINFFNISGLSAIGLNGDPKLHPGYAYSSPPIDCLTIVPDNFEILVGNYNFRCIKTSGHTDGHMCLYDEKERLLLSGDHILGKITPNITLWELNKDCLENYIQSLEKIDELEVDLVLPGHRKPILDCHGRIAELKIHHENRMKNIIDILGTSAMNAQEVASKMQWSLSYKNFDEFPWSQKLFATGEAFSHLYHLAMINKLHMITKDDIVYFRSY